MDPVHEVDLGGLENRLRQGKSPLHPPDGKGSHVYEGPEVSINRPRLGRLEPIAVAQKGTEKPF